MSNNTHTLIFALNLSTPIKELNVFEIGTNKKRVDKEHIQKLVARNIPNRIHALKELLEEEKKKGKKIAIHLALPAYILELIITKHANAYEELKTINKIAEVEFLLSTYYGTALQATHPKELAIQLKAEQKLINHYFGKEAKLFFTNDNYLTKEHTKALKKIGVKAIINAHNGETKVVQYNNTVLPVFYQSKEENSVTKMHVYSFMNIIKEQKQEEIKELIEVISKTGGKLELLTTTINTTKAELILKNKTNNEKCSEMETKLIKELKGLYPHVMKTEDQELITEWRFLANKELIQQANPKLASQEHSPYEYYANYMNALNDITHTIRTIQAIQNNQPLPQKQIFAEPSQILEKIVVGGEENIIEEGGEE